MDLGQNGQIGQPVRERVQTVSYKRMTLREKHDPELALTLHQLMVVISAKAVKMMSTFVTRMSRVVNFYYLLHHF